MSNNQEILLIIGNHYEKFGHLNIIRFESIVAVLVNAYNEFIKEGIPSISQLPLQQKNEYWEQSKRYYNNQKNCVKACKAIYVLHLITSQ